MGDRAVIGRQGVVHSIERTQCVAAIVMRYRKIWLACDGRVVAGQSFLETTEIEKHIALIKERWPRLGPRLDRSSVDEASKRFFKPAERGERRAAIEDRVREAGLQRARPLKGHQS